MDKIERLKKQLEEAEAQQKEAIKQEENIIQSYKSVFIKCICDFNQIKTLETKQAIRRIAKNIARQFNLLYDVEKQYMETDFNGFAKKVYSAIKESEKNTEGGKE